MKDPTSASIAGAVTKTGWAGRLIALLGGGVLALSAAEIVVRTAMPHWREFWAGGFITVDTSAGTALLIGRPGYDGMFAQSDGDFRVRVRINEHGLRNDAPVTAAHGQIWAVGDSMTFGWGVEAEQTFAEVAERAIGRGVYNVAWPGADVRGYHALIKRMPADVRPAAVIVGLIVENDLAAYSAIRSGTLAFETDVGGDLGPLYWVKELLAASSALYNFLAVTLKRSNIVVNILVAIGVVDQTLAYPDLPDRADVDASIASTADELVALRRLLPEDAPFAVLVVPGRFEIRDGDPLYRDVRMKMHAALAARGIAAIDVFEDLRSAGFAATHFAHDGHWNARGHEIAGQAVAAWLRTQGLDGDGGVR